MEARRRLIERCHDRPNHPRYRRNGHLPTIRLHMGSTATASAVTWFCKLDPHRNTNRASQQQRSWPRSNPCDEPANGRPHASRSNCTDGIAIARRTVTKIPRNLGLPSSPAHLPEQRKQPQTTVHHTKRPGQVVRVDIKKVEKIPDSGGCRDHGRGSEQAKQSQRRRTKKEQGPRR